MRRAAASVVRDTSKPTIARVRGVCVGGGFELAQLCDIQIASDTARFGVTPAQFPDYQGLVGDKIDDIPGVPSVGARTAAAHAVSLPRGSGQRPLGAPG